MNILIKAVVLGVGVVMAAPLQAGEFCVNNSIIETQFKQLDTNGDGLINKAEVNAKPEVISDMLVYGEGSFEMGDINSDGVLNWEEFKANEEMLPVE